MCRQVRHDVVELKDNFTATKTTQDVEDLTMGVMVVNEDDGLGAKVCSCVIGARSPLVDCFCLR